MHKVKIDVYLTKEQKDRIQSRANNLGLSVSDYTKLKALDLLREKSESYKESAQSSSEKVKIDVYLNKEHKEQIQARANKVGLSVSDYMKLKALDLLKEDNVE